MSFRGNYLDVTPDDVLRLSPEDADVLAVKVAQMILAEFRALDCTVCEKHFAYQHRGDHRILLCSSECLALAQKKLKLMTTSAGSNLRLSTSSLASPGLLDGTHTVAAQRTLNYVTKLQDSKALGAEPQKNSKSGDTENYPKDVQEPQLIDTTDGVVPNNVGKRQPFGSLDSALNVKKSQVCVPKISSNSSPFHPKAPATKIIEEPKLSPPKTSPFIAQPEKAKTGPVSPPAVQPKQSPYGRSNESRETYGNGRQVAMPAAVENKEPNLPKMKEVRRAIVTPPALKTIDIKESSTPSRTVVAPQIQQKIPARSPTVSKPEATEAKPEQTSVEQPKLPVVKNIVRRPQSKKVWSTADIKRSTNIKAGAKCYVNFAWSPARLTITAVSDWDNLESMRNEVKKYCESAEPLSRPPFKNDIVFASYNDGFYRAVVLEVRKEKGEVDILFPDDGDKICVQVSDCRSPSDEIMIKHPIYGAVFECITSLPVPDDLPVTQSELLEGEVSFGEETETPNGWRGKLFAHIKDGDKKICWNDILEQSLKKLAAPQKAVESQAEGTLKDPAIIKAGKVTPPLSASNHTLLTIPISPKFKNGSAVTVAFCWNPREIVVSAVDDSASTNDLAVLVKNYVSKAKPLTDKPAINDVVLCPYFGEYYRGVVEELLEDGTIRCRFIDYGDEATVKLGELREINDAVAAHPIYGLMLTMAEIPEEKLDSIPPTVEVLQPAITDQLECKLEMKEEINHGIWKGDLRVPSGHMWTTAVLDALKGGANRK